MDKEFCTYEQALALKELGIDFVPIGYHRYDMKRKPVISNETAVRIHGSTDCLNHPAILYQQAFRWFREKYKLNGRLNHYPNTKLWDFSIHNLLWNGKEFVENVRKEDRSLRYSTYEEAETACLAKLIEIVEQKEK